MSHFENIENVNSELDIWKQEQATKREVERQSGIQRREGQPPNEKT